MAEFKSFIKQQYILLITFFMGQIEGLERNKWQIITHKEAVS